MKSKDQWIADFHEWIPFAESLKSIDDHVWSSPIGEGKWSVHDIVSHILRWDEYYLEEALIHVVQGTPLQLKHIDFDDFNRDAVDWGKDLTREALLQASIQMRNRILKALQRIPEAEYNKEFAAQDQTFIVKNYIEDFIWHDQHHMKQIQDFRYTAYQS